MNFVYDIDLFSSHSRRILDTLPKLTNIIHTVIGRCINFNNIHKSAFFDGHTVGAAAAWPFSVRKAVDSLCKNPRRCCLSRTSGSAEKVSVADSFRLYLVFQYSYNMILSDDLGKYLRALRPIQRCIHLAASKAETSAKDFPYTAFTQSPGTFFYPDRVGANK